jgi:uncharacterized lipoprotein YmbA
MRFRVLFILFFLLLYGGCSSKEFYTLGDISNIRVGDSVTNEFIGVEQVKVPAYLMTSPIYVKKSSYHIEKIDNANWVNSMDEHLTSVLIAYLQKYMNNPNIYLYPWSRIRHIDKKLTLIINDFIASSGEVHLSARYRILDKKSNKIYSYFYETKEIVDGKRVEDMIRAMEKAYFKLIRDISKHL